MNRLRSKPYRELRERAGVIAAARSALVPRGRDHYADVLGEIAFAQAFDIAPSIFDFFDDEQPLFWLDGFPIVIAGTVEGEAIIPIVRTWTDERTYLVIATHTPASAAASLTGWISDQRVLWSNTKDGDYLISLSDLWLVDDLRAECERRAAQEYALTQLVEERTLADGKQLEIYWWTDKDSAAIAIDGKTVDYIYGHDNYGVKQWRRVRDESNYVFKSWTAARDAAIDAATSPADAGEPTLLRPIHQQRPLTRTND